MIESALIWSIRGIGNKSSFANLSKHVQSYKIRMVAILEPKIPFCKAGKVRNKLKFDHVIGNDED